MPIESLDVGSKAAEPDCAFDTKALILNAVAVKGGGWPPAK
jgi:hypothetical protein